MALLRAVRGDMQRQEERTQNRALALSSPPLASGRTQGLQLEALPQDPIVPLPRTASSRVDSPIRNIDAEMPTKDEVLSFLRSEEQHQRKGAKDPTFSQYSEEDLADLLLDTLQRIGTHGPEAMLLLRKRSPRPVIALCGMI